MPEDLDRIYGVAACRAIAQRRPEDVRRAYLEPRLMRVFGWFLEDLARRRVGYNLVEAEDLRRITNAVHHEGVCFYVEPAPIPRFDDVLDDAAALQRVRGEGPPLRLLYLDGVRNPHNLGAILRTAAHFGVRAVLLPRDGSAPLSPAAIRIAEGGAESVDVIYLNRPVAALMALREREVPVVVGDAHDAKNLYEASLPPRCVIALGAEREGPSEEVSELALERVAIPGTGDVESLNVGTACAILLAEHARRFGAGGMR